MTDEIASSRLEKDGAGGSSTQKDSSVLQIISLVGFMGAGKTTVGRELARRLGWRFEDLDDLIQLREARSIELIFQQQGELAFREMERRMMSEILTAAGSRPTVLALGGGSFCFDPIREMLSDSATPVVFLDAPLDELFRRSEQPEVIRPLRVDREHFRRLYEQRQPAYLRAQLRIETGNKSVIAVVEEIVSGLKLGVVQVPGTGAGE